MLDITYRVHTGFVGRRAKSAPQKLKILIAVNVFVLTGSVFTSDDICMDLFDTCMLP